MSAIPNELSDTALLLLGRAADREDRLVCLLPTLPPAARGKVSGSLLRKGLVEQVAAPLGMPELTWGADHDGAPFALRVTDEGLRMINVEVAREGRTASQAGAEPPMALSAPADSTGLSDAPVAPAASIRRKTMPGAVLEVLAAWRGCAANGAAIPKNLEEALERLATLLATAPRRGSKQEAVLNLLRRPEGASGPAIADAMGWAPHTVRGFLASLAKKGVVVKVVERIRRSRSSDAVAGASFTIYRVEAGDHEASR